MVTFYVLSFFRWLNVLSLDVVLISLAWQEVFARVALVALKWEERALLAVSIWIIYIVDHWLDVTERISFSNEAPRHDYIKTHRLLIGGLLALASLINLWLLKHLSLNLTIAGILLASITAGYLVINYFLMRQGRWLKGREIIISFIFSIGCALVSIMQSHRPSLLFPWIVAFSVIALINCTLIARMERKVSILGLAPCWTFHQQSVLGFCVMMMTFSFFSPPIVRALCWSLVGLTFVPMIARRFGYEVASLAADQALFFAALFALMR